MQNKKKLIVKNDFEGQHEHLHKKTQQNVCKQNK